MTLRTLAVPTQEHASTAAAPLTFTVAPTPETVEALRSLVAEALAEQQTEPRGPVLLDRNGLAQALGVSLATVDRLAKQGMPSIWLVDSRRFVLADVLAWLRSREPAK